MVPEIIRLPFEVLMILMFIAAFIPLYGIARTLDWIDRRYNN